MGATPVTTGGSIVASLLVREAADDIHLFMSLMPLVLFWEVHRAGFTRDALASRRPFYLVCVV